MRNRQQYKDYYSKKKSKHYLPLFDYCDIVWSNWKLQHDMDRLQRQFNRSVCIKLSEKDCLVHRSLSTVLSPSRMGPCASSPVPRISRSPLRENEVPEREAGRRTFLFRGEKIFNELEPQSLKACPV